MATPTIEALPQPIQGNVLIRINWSATPAVTFASVYRNNVDGTQTPVRSNTSTDASGTAIELSAGMAVLYDTEAPPDVALTYTTTATNSASTATSAEIIMTASGYLWLRDPINPAGNLRVGLTPPPSLPDCIPGQGIFFGGMGDRNLGTQSTNWTVNNSSTPIALQQVRAAPTSSLPLILRTFGDYDALKALMGQGSAILLSIPAKYGYEGGYVNFGDLVVARVNADYTVQWQFATAPYVTVRYPGGLSYGTLGTRWIDMCSVYPTFADATAANVTWENALLGNASIVSPPTALRTWANVLANFASWNAVNTGGRTWQGLLEGH